MFETNYSNCTGRSTTNICSSSEGAQGKGKRGWNSIYHQFTTKIGGKTSLGPLISFCKIRFPVKHLMPYDAETGHSRPLIAWLSG